MQPTEDALVFIVDDDAGVREALAWLLRSRRLPSQSFESADDFAAFLNTHGHPWQPTQPGCLLLDVRMPGMSGLALFEHLMERQLLAVLPVIFLTGHADVPTAVDSVKRGAFDFCEKPLTASNRPWHARRRPCRTCEANKTCNTTWPI
jgi:two-component system response regulator DctR